VPEKLEEYLFKVTNTRKYLRGSNMKAKKEIVNDSKSSPASKDNRWKMKNGRRVVAEGIEFNTDEKDPLDFIQLLKWSFKAIQNE
jgi:hypothetical protein